MPRNTLTWKKYIWKFNCSTSRPFQKGSVYKVLPIFEVCIFISKTELWKNTAPARRSCLLAHVEPFFHFQNSVGDHMDSVRVCVWGLCFWMSFPFFLHFHRHRWLNQDIEIDRDRIGAGEARLDWNLGPVLATTMVSIVLVYTLSKAWQCQPRGPNPWVSFPMFPMTSLHPMS